MALIIIFIIIAATLVLAVIFLIPALTQIRRTSLEAEKFFETIRLQIVPLAHDLTVLSQQANGILQSVQRQVGKTEEALTAFRDTAVRLRDFEEEILRKIQEPLSEIATLLGAVGRGAGALIRIFRR
jgi:uncharacterized protein YoxC